MSQSRSISEHLLDKAKTHKADPFTPLGISYQNLVINAKVKKDTKTILYEQQGTLRPGSFTVILGPSGSGKTTLLNFLSGRLVSDNLTIEGSYYLNGRAVESIEPYASNIAYIMQDDILLQQMTPRESFMFVVNLRFDIPKEERREKVQVLIEKLGLNDCCDTKIGSNTKKGISGGERKRTSIGVDLIISPSMIFLDEPTTGLDSTTALQVIVLLRQLANEGRTVVSTIHQPSSEVFAEFDRLMLLVEGRCIFQGKTKEADNYFRSIGYECPNDMSHSEFYMDLMSFHYKESNALDGQDRNQDYEQKREEYLLKMKGLQEKYQSQLKKVSKEEEQTFYKQFLRDKEQTSLLEQPSTNYKVNGFKQFWYVFQRGAYNEIRSPFSLALRFFQCIFMSGILLLVFGRINTTNIDDISDTGLIQKTRGMIFFLVSFSVMTGLQATLNTFSGEKPNFLRQRFSRTYSTLAYFWGRSLSNLPFEIIYGSVPCIIIFWGSGLNNNSPWNFPTLLLICNSVYFVAISYGLFYSAVIPKLETAMAMVPLLIIPFMMLSGFFISLDKVPKAFIPLEYLSPFRYGFQAISLNQFHGKEYLQFLDYTPSTIMMNVIIVLVMGVLLRVISFVAMVLISSPKRPKINQHVKTTGQSNSQTRQGTV